MPGKLILLIDSSTHTRFLIIFLHIALLPHASRSPNPTHAHPTAHPSTSTSPSTRCDTDTIIIFITAIAYTAGYLLLILFISEDLFQGAFFVDFVELLAVAVVEAVVCVVCRVVVCRGYWVCVCVCV